MSEPLILNINMIVQPEEIQRIKDNIMKQMKDEFCFNKWILVSERLPEFSTEVLTCSNGGFIEIQSLEESYDGYWENQKGDWSDFNEIIAWMPLPEPYKEDK